MIYGADGKVASDFCPKCAESIVRFNEAVKQIIILTAHLRLMRETVEDLGLSRKFDRQRARLEDKGRLKFHIDEIVKEGARPKNENPA